MKILYVTTLSNTVNSFLVPHIKLLIEEGHLVDVACKIEEDISEKISGYGCNIHDIPFSRSPLSKGNLTASRALKKLLANGQYDIVHTHTPNASMVVRFVCRKFKDIQVIYTAHGFHFFKGAPIKNWLLYYPIEKWLSKHTDYLITINEEDHTTSKRKLKALQNIWIKGVGVNLSVFSPPTIEEKQNLRERLGYKAEDFILIFVAELNYNKNQKLLIEVVSLLKDEIPNLKLLLVDTGVLENDYKELANTLEVENEVDFLGYRNDVADLMKIADISCSSSLREGLPVNIMEAMATGLPLVVSNCRGNRDLATDGINGYVVDVNDSQLFANKILKLYKNNELREEFSKKSTEKVLEYSENQVMKELKKFYKMI